jgi:hypothetical protein
MPELQLAAVRFAPLPEKSQGRERNPLGLLAKNEVQDDGYRREDSTQQQGNVDKCHAQNSSAAHNAQWPSLGPFYGRRKET